MRRGDKEVTERSELEAIISRATVCRLAMCEENRPYLVPLSFGMEGDSLYVHGAARGRKWEILRRNPQVCFEFEVDAEVVSAEKGCDWSMHYKSVVGFGCARFLTELEEKRRGLQCIMGHCSGKEFALPDGAVNRTVVVEIAIKSMTGKRSPA